MPFAATWMDLEGIMLSEISQMKTNIYDITILWNLKIYQTIECNNNEKSRFMDIEDKLVFTSGKMGRAKGQNRDWGLRVSNYYV